MGTSEFELADIFIDIFEAIGPTLSIMDAIVSLDSGPTALGKPVKTGRILAATYPAALDIVAAKMIGYQVAQVPLLIQALKWRLISNESTIETIATISLFPFTKIVKSPLDGPYNQKSIFVTKTYVNFKINLKKCNNCQLCATACPVKAIALANDKMVLDQTNAAVVTTACLSVPSKRSRLPRI